VAEAPFLGRICGGGFESVRATLKVPEPALEVLGFAQADVSLAQGA
jgi:hypothetical protein